MDNKYRVISQSDVKAVAYGEIKRIRSEQVCDAEMLDNTTRGIVRMADALIAMIEEAESDAP